jgi:hypothetical protein
MVVDSVFNLASTVINKIWPDPVERDKAMFELEKMRSDGQLARLVEENKLDLAQIEVNKVEAASSSLFVSGWRPAVGWVCVFGVGYTYLGQPLLSWLSSIVDVPVPPKLDIEQLMALVLGMLGMGGMRTVEKIRSRQ